MAETWTGSGVAIPGSEAIDLVSSVNGREYRLLIATPLVPPPAAGYRILYLLDGNRYFASATEAVRCNFNAPDVIVVGIGYPETEAFFAQSVENYGPLSPLEAGMPSFLLSFMRERTFDMSLPVQADHGFPGIHADPTRSGGLDGFIETIEREIMPLIEAKAPIDRTGTALFGHSLGGLAVLHALFTRPSLVRNFIAASPSIWWADRAILKHLPTFAGQLEQTPIDTRLLVTMGADESTPLRLPPGRDPGEALALLRYADMVENGRALVAQLQALPPEHGLEVADYAIFAHQGHGISVWPALGRAVEFAFQQA
jgi:predicted alpha/beta superfamily hydrolase